jgi:hypothetical protein
MKYYGYSHRVEFKKTIGTRQGALTKRCSAVSQNSKTSGYFANSFACFVSVLQNFSHNIPQEVSRNGEIKNISRNSSKREKQQLTSHDQKRVWFLFRETAKHTIIAGHFMKLFICFTSLFFADQVKWNISQNGKIVNRFSKQWNILHHPYYRRVKSLEISLWSSVPLWPLCPFYALCPICGLPSSLQPSVPSMGLCPLYGPLLSQWPSVISTAVCPLYSPLPPHDLCPSPPTLYTSMALYPLYGSLAPLWPSVTL